MKTLYHWLLGLLCLTGMAACSEESGLGLPQREGNRALVAHIAEDGGQDVSRVAVSPTGLVTWMQKDAIGLFGSDVENVKFVTLDEGATATFTGYLPTADTSVDYAYYPYSEDATLAGRTLTLTLPDRYTYTGTSYAPMLGRKGTDGSFSFRQLCGLLRISLGGGMPADADRFVITSVGTDAPALAGVGSVADVTVADASLALSAGGQHSVSYALDGITAEEAYQNFFVPLPAGDYPLIEVSFYRKNADAPVFTRSISHLQVARAGMVSMPILNWNTGEQFVLNEQVQVLADVPAGQVAVNDADNSQLVYQAAAAGSVPVVGSVVWSRVSDEFPDGFIGRVTNVTTNGDGSCTVATQPASLSEVFDELYVDETIVLEPEATPAARGRALNEMNVFGFHLNAEADVQYGSGAPLKVTGKLQSGQKLMATFILNKQEQMERAAITLEQSASVELEVTVNGEFTPEPIVKKLAGIRFAPLPLAGGLIRLTPVIDFNFICKAEGKVESQATFRSETYTCIGAEYKDGAWRTGSNTHNKALNESPWNFTGQLTLEGKIGMGFGLDCQFKLYNLDNMKVAVKPELTGNLSGEFSVDSNVENLEQLLSDTYLVFNWELGADIEVDASLLSPEDELKHEFEVASFTFGERKLYVLPFFKDKLAALKAKDQSASTRQAAFTANVEREMISKGTKISVQVQEKGSAGSPLVCTPSGYTGSKLNDIIESTMPMAPSADPEAMSVDLEDLLEETTYEVTPVVYSPLLEGIVPEGKLALQTNKVDLSTRKTMRDQLIQLYQECGGAGWTRKANWCTDAPIDEWEGVTFAGDGYYVELPENNLQGQVTFHTDSLLYLRIEKNTGITSVDVSDCTELYYMTCLECSLRTLSVTNCSKLVQLYCENNQLSSLDVSGCDKMTMLYCYANNLSTLNVSGCTAMKWLSCGQNQLTALDVSDCPQMQILQCGSNQLSELDITVCTQLMELICSSNQLTALEVYSPELKQLWCYNNNITTLDVSGCAKLESLDFSKTKINSIDLSLCAALKYLTCDGTELTSLDVRACHNLKGLFISDNPLTSLNVNGCAALTTLQCNSTELTSLDISTCHNLQYLYIHDNRLSSLNMNGCAELLWLDCRDCQLTSLDVGGCSHLGYLECGRNDLTTLDISDCLELKTFSCRENPQLSTIQWMPSPCLESLVCYSTSLTSEIPDWFSSVTNLTYDQRFSYNRYNPETGRYDLTVDNGHGWWYPGEPESGYHGR